MNTLNTYPQSNTKSIRISTKNMTLVGMFAAVMAVFSQISLPMPTGVPITIQVFGVTLIGVILGWRLGVLSILVYILVGAAGLPVFAGFRGGIASLTGFTGGYIWTWPVMVLLCGIRPKTSNRIWNLFLTLLLCLLGLAVNETIGGLQWAALAGNMTLRGVFTYSMVAFVPKDILLTVLAILTGIQMRRILSRASI